MNLDRALQLNTAALAVMGALFLGLGHESLVLPLALGLAAVASATLTKTFRWLRLNRLIANIVALAAVIWSLRNFLDVNSHDQLLAIADMLVYLQIVLLFQEKTGRVYWQLIVLSLLQVVVAAALSLGPQFGLLLGAYMALALTALVLLCLHREWKRLSDLAMVRAPASADWKSLLARPYASPPAEAAAPIPVRPAMIARQVLLLAVANVLFAAVFFYVTPRLSEGAWSGSRGGTHAITGFSAEASLEEQGRIHQSNQLVMRVSLSSAADRKPYLMIGEPYFNGMALSQYVRDAAGARWTTMPPQTGIRLKVTPQLVGATTASSQVRQEITIESPSSQMLFVLLPLQRVPTGFQFYPVSNRLVRTNQDEFQPLGELRFRCNTLSLRGGRQLRGIPHRNPLLSVTDEYLLHDERARHLLFDEERFAILSSLADKVLRDEQLADADPLAKSLALERHFASSGLYRYSLSLDFARDPELDPVEDFVANHKTGHCEYFASALVLMLRSQGIPARMIVGYKGGDFNSLGHYYQVRQRHAHAWVEALLPADAVPPWDVAGPRSAGGVWYRLDPTPPPIAGPSPDLGENALDRVVEAFDYMELLWRDYVLGLNASKQQDSIYDPVTSRALGSLPEWLETRHAHRLARRMAGMLGLELPGSGRQDGNDSRAFDWRTSIAFMALIALSLLAAQGLYLLIGHWKRLRARGRRDRAARRPSPPRFYRRLESLLSRMALRRAAGQTAAEFATVAAQRLEHQGTPAPAAALPREIVAAYYRVRFGGDALDSDELAAIEQALAQLTPVVNQARP